MSESNVSLAAAVVTLALTVLAVPAYLVWSRLSDRARYRLLMCVVWGVALLLWAECVRLSLQRLGVIE